MDGRSFDRVARALAAGGTRRGILRGVAAGLVGGAALHESAGAARRRRPVCVAAGANCTRHGQCCTGVCDRVVLPGSRHPRYRCACDAGRTLCSGKCVDLQTDMANCGACGDVCDGDECVDGACVGGRSFTCPDLSASQPICYRGVNGSTYYGYCDWGDDSKLVGPNVDVVPVTCSTDAECTAAYWDCSQPDVECHCITDGGGLVNNEPVYRNVFEFGGIVSTCIMMTTASANCKDAGFGQYNCAFFGEPCTVDDDCCTKSTRCGRSKVCLVQAGEACTDNADCASHFCSSNVCA
jgi:hypothetical protein